MRSWSDKGTDIVTLQCLANFASVRLETSCSVSRGISPYAGLEEVCGCEQHRSQLTRNAVSIDCGTRKEIVVHEAFAVIVLTTGIRTRCARLMNQFLKHQFAYPAFSRRECRAATAHRRAVVSLEFPPRELDIDADDVADLADVRGCCTCFSGA